MTTFLLTLIYLTAADTLTGKVVRIADGNTVTILVGVNQVRIRLFGIDAPERGQDYSRKSCAKQSLGRGDVSCHREQKPFVGTQWVNPTRQSVICSRKRVLRGVRVTGAAKRRQPVQKPCY